MAYHQPSNELFNVVRSAVGLFTCPKHHQQYTCIQNFELFCDSCPDVDKAQSISTFFERPLFSLVEFYSPKKVFDPEVLAPGFLAGIRKNLRQSETALDAYLAVLEKSTMTQCKFMREAYQRLSEESVRRLEQHLGYLQGVNKIYLDSFYEKLGTAELTEPKHVAQLLKDFINGSEDPTHSLTLRLEYVKEIVRDFPFLKLESLKQLYSEICDPARWQLSNYMDNASRQEETIIEPNLIKLLDRSHLLRYDKNCVELLDLSRLIVGQLPTGADLCFEIDRFRLVISDQKEITIFSYLNPESPKKLDTLTVRYPMNIRFRKGHIYFVSEGKLQKYHVNSSTISSVVSGKVKQYKLSGDNLLVLHDRTYEQYDTLTGKKQPLTKQQFLNAK